MDTVPEKWEFHHKFDDEFECGVDEDGIIWYKSNAEFEFERPCMKLCYDLIKLRDPSIAKRVLALSCQIQDNDAITFRALRHYDLS